MATSRKGRTAGSTTGAAPNDLAILLATAMRRGIKANFAAPLVLAHCDAADTDVVVMDQLIDRRRIATETGR